MTKKIRVGVLFGGRSAEHEISLLSAQNIIAAMDKSKYEIVLVGIDKNGEWHLRDADQVLLHADDPKLISLRNVNKSVAVIPREDGRQLVSLSSENFDPQTLDVIFPVLHGTYGEDGTVQGLLKLADIPFVGSGVLGSAVGMDKDVMKRLLRDAQIPIAKFLTLHIRDKQKICFEEVVEEVGLPFFVKPANAGSSVGVSKVKEEASFEKAINEAFLYDRKILIEEFISGRELECSVIGNEDPIASLPGEVITQEEFYSYEAKYIDNRTFFQIPAELSDKEIRDVQAISIKSYKVLCCEGMARVDLFLNAEGKTIVNEINTIPGFTNTSMYPKLWEKSGMPYTEMVDLLIALAFERYNNEKQLKTTFK